MIHSESRNKLCAALIYCQRCDYEHVCVPADGGNESHKDISNYSVTHCIINFHSNAQLVANRLQMWSDAFVSFILHAFSRAFIQNHVMSDLFIQRFLHHRLFQSSFMVINRVNYANFIIKFRFRN